MGRGPNVKEKRTVVQHSGCGYAGNPQFYRGLETRGVYTKAEQDLVLREGGILFDSWSEAEDFCEQAMYPEGYDSIIPCARGAFSKKKIDGLFIYIPIREAIG